MISSRTFAGNFLIQTGSRAAAIVIGFVLTLIMTRALGPHGFGEFSIATTTLQLLGTLVDFGLTISLVVLISAPGVTEAEERKIVQNVIGMRFLFGIFVYGLGACLMLLFPLWSEAVRHAIQIGAVAYLLSSCSSVVIGVFQKHACMWRGALAELLNRVAQLAFVLIVVATAPTVEWMAVSILVGNVVWLFAVFVLLRPFASFSPRFDWNIWRQAIQASWPIAISTILNLVYLRGDLFFLSLFRSTEEVGLYGLAYRVVDVLTQLPVIFMGILLPSLVSDWAKQDRAAFAVHLNRAFAFFSLLGFPLVAGGLVVGTSLAVFMGGEAFTGAGPILSLLLIALLGIFFGGMYGHAIVAVEKQRMMLWGYGAAALVATIGYLLLIPPFGMWGAASVTIAIEALIAITSYTIVTRAVGTHPDFRIPTKALLSSIVMGLVLVALPTFPVLFEILLGAGVYGVSLLLLGVRPPKTV